MILNEFSPVIDRSRRRFINNLAKIAGPAVLLSAPVKGFAGNFFMPAETWTVGQIMDQFIKEVPGAPFEKTVDTLKSGSRDAKVTGIVTTMFPTIEIIQKTISAGANFIICHEPSFYNHLDETDWLKNDEVFNYKMDLLKKHGITIWRNHDYIHRHTPDGVLTGVVARLQWEKYFDKKENIIVFNRAISLQTLIGEVKTKLGISTLRYIGDLSQKCRNILLLPGAYGGRLQISITSTKKPDTLICGEISEWETAEYIRDANAKGQKITLLILGHVASEEPGSIYMAEWLRKKFPGVKVTHIPSENPLSFL